MSRLLEAVAGKSGADQSDAFYEHLRLATRNRDVPYWGAFELTPRCTLDCRMCYSHLRPEQMRTAELSTDTWLSLADAAFEMGMGEVILTGGECLMHPGFREIYEALHKKGVLIELLSNGTMLDEAWVTWLADHPPSAMQISVYGCSEETYGEITGNAAAFGQVDRALALLRAADIRFTTAMTVTRAMLPHAEAIYRYCLSKEPLRLDVSAHLFRPKEETCRDADAHALSVEERIALNRRLTALGGFSEPSPPPPPVPAQPPESARAPIRGVPCGAGRNSFSISWDGTLQPCLTFTHIRAYPLSDGFAGAWADLNRQVKEYLPPQECGRCPQAGSCRKCVLEHYADTKQQGVASPRICEQARQMALAGL